MQYEKEVAEKVWRGGRSGWCHLAVVEVFMREGAGVEGEVTIGKNRKKNHNPEISVQKNANIDGGVISFNRWKT